MLLAAIRIPFKIYRWVISPFIHTISGSGAGCRFTPTCSEFMLESIQKLGWKRGLFLGTQRICRCHPFTKGGWDPVPEK